MTVLDIKAVRDFLSDNNVGEKIAEAYALRTLVDHATYPEGYAADPRWVDLVVPSTYGDALLAKVSDSTIPYPDLHMALFCLFWFQDLLIDPIRTDVSGIREIIESESIARKVMWPMSQGRNLYDAYNATYPTEVRDRLSAEDSSALLRQNSQGIYQSGRLVTGPLGIIESECVRVYEPESRIGLWHCRMVDCGQLHPVRFTPPHIAVLEAFRLLHKAAVEEWNTASRWRHIVETWPHEAGEAWRAYTEMPLFLGDCIVGADRIRLLERVLTSDYSATVRSILRTRCSDRASGSPLQVASNLSPDEQLQVLLTVQDRALMHFIDELVWSGAIKVPPSELREVAHSKRSLSTNQFSFYIQLTSLGIRIQRKHPVLNLRTLLWKAYTEGGDTSELDWRLRKPQGLSTQSALMEYLRIAKPPAAIETLILTSPKITKAVAQALGTRVDLPDDKTRAMLEWKLGFDSPRADQRLSAMYEVIAAFAETLSRVGAQNSDDDRRAIRSTGVNVFVELEGFLDELISYIVWLLCSDHPKVTQFIYLRAAATRSVAQVLGSSLAAGTDEMRWIDTGNTLGTCTRYLQQLSDWLGGLMTTDRSELLRSDDEINESDNDSVTLFPFRHTQLWADANPDSLRDLAASVRNCANILNRAEVAGIRNGLEHFRESHRFPSADRLSTAVEAIRQLVDYADRTRLIPKFYWFAGYRRDSFRQSVYEVVDYRGEMLSIHAPRTVRGLSRIASLSPARPVLVAPGNLLGVPNADLLFGVNAQSVYSDYWQNYPARRGAIVLRSSEEELATRVGRDRGFD